MIFNFIVRYLGPLKHVPILAWLMDALLMMWSMISNPSIILAIDRIEERMLLWKEVTLTIHKYGGVQFNYHFHELGHIHSNGVMDIPFNRHQKKKLLCRGLAADHHIFKKSGWISFYIGSEDDVEQAIRLLTLRYRQVADQHASDTLQKNTKATGSSY